MVVARLLVRQVCRGGAVGAGLRRARWGVVTGTNTRLLRKVHAVYLLYWYKITNTDATLARDSEVGGGLT
jgi:hypothetical protein